MLVDNRIERYVKSVTCQLPLQDRGRAERELFAMVSDLVRDYAGGREPDILDARAVIEELGSPKEMAGAWLDQLQEEREAFQEGGISAVFAELSNKAGIHVGEVMNPVSAQRILRTVITVCMLVSACFVVFGLLALGTHTIKSMLPIFIGCVMALVSMTGRTALIRQYDL